MKASRVWTVQDQVVAVAQAGDFTATATAARGRRPGSYAGTRLHLEPHHREYGKSVANPVSP